MHHIALGIIISSPNTMVRSLFILLLFLVSVVINPHLSLSLETSSSDTLFKSEKDKQVNSNDYWIDERFPTIISNTYSNGDPRERDNETYFGASVTLFKHELSNHTWLFIGEPKGSGIQTSRERGILWQCGFNFFNSDLSLTNEMKDYCHMNQIKDVIQAGYPGGTWLGGSISIISNSQSPQLITCAHQKKSENCVSMSGACYVFSMDQFHPKQPYNPARNINVTSKIHPNTKCDRTQERDGNNIVHGFDRGAFGMSLNVNQDQVFVGAPDYNSITTLAASHFGSLSDWPINLQQHPEFKKKIDVHYKPYYGYAVTSGNYYQLPTIKTDRKVTYFAGGSPRENDQKGAVYISKRDDSSHIQVLNGFHLGSYFGSVLYTQDMNGDGIDEIFVGAPYTGQLKQEFFSRKNHPFIMEEIVTKIVNSQSKRSINATSQQTDGDAGCVYVYQNKGKETLEVVQILPGGNKPFARFGSAISSIQLLADEQSVRKYIVIGAPYENGDEGAIYFYKAKELLKTRMYAKRITASQISTGMFSSSRKFRGFGFSFSTNQENADVDGNGTPDLVIGSYLSKDVIVLRTRHQIKCRSQTMKIEAVDGVKVEKGSFPLKNDSLNFELGVTVEWFVPWKVRQQQQNLQRDKLYGYAYIIDTFPHLEFWSRVKLDELEERYKITWTQNFLPNSFQPQIDNKTIEFFYFLLNDTTSHDQLATFTTSFLVTRVQTFNEEDAEIPAIDLTLKSWYNTTLGLPPSRTDFKIINDKSSGRKPQSQQPTVEKSLVSATTNEQASNVNVNENMDHFGSFLPSPVTSSEVKSRVYVLPNHCNDPSKCEPTLRITNIHFLTLDQGMPVVLKDNIFTLGTSHEILLKWTIENTNEEKEVAILPGAFIQFTLVNASTNGNSSWSLLNLDEHKGCERNESVFRCNYAGYILSQQNTTMQVSLNMTGFDRGKWEQRLKVQLTPTHAHDELLGGRVPEAETTTELKIVADSKVSIFGNRSPKEISGENKAFKQTYKVSVKGSSPIDKVVLEFGIPLKRKTEDKNLILVYKPTISEVTGAPVDPNILFSCNPTTPFAKLPAIRSARTLATAKMVADDMSLGSNESALQQSSEGIEFHGSKVSLWKPSVNSTSVQPSHKNTKEKSLEFSGKETIELKCPELGLKKSPLDNKMESQGISCMHVQCIIRNTPKDANYLVEFPMELSNLSFSILSTKTNSKDTILIQSVAIAKILEGANPKIHIDTDFSEVKVHFKIGTENEKVPAWIYIVGVLGGLMILVLSAAILKRLGFFKRDMKEKLDTLRRDSQPQVHELNNLSPAKEQTTPTIL